MPFSRCPRFGVDMSSAIDPAPLYRNEPIPGRSPESLPNPRSPVSKQSYTINVDEG